MSRLIRFLSRRRTGKGIKRGAQDSTDHHKKKKNILDCRVVLLDDSDVSIELPKSALGDALQQRVFYHLDLLETSYFGLQYTDAYNVNHWLDPTKKIKKQLAIGPPYTLRLRVKFFPTEPSVLKEELTKYQFFMQCKKDVLTGAMPVDDEALAVELAALALQSELGDYDEDEHTPAVVSEFRFVPNQSEEMEVAIFEKYKSIAGQKMTPDKAELQYLHKVKWLDMYGVDIHDVLGRDGLKYKLGLTPTGVLVFAGEERIGLFYWPRIVKFNFKKKRLILVVIEEETEGTQEPQEHTFVFTSENSKACKHVWKCAIEHHTFFRVVVQPVTERHGRQGFIRLGSRFRYSGRTQFEQLNRSNARRSVTFERQPSKRFSRRASLDAKELKNRRRRPPGLSAEVIANSYATAVPSHSPSGGGAKVDSPHNGSPGSPMERLDNLIASGDRNGTLNSRTGRSDRETTPTGASGGGTLNKNRSILDHAEAAQAKLKGLSDTPEAPPRPNKDVNLYQNNQVKVLSKEKVQIEIKSNNLKSRSGDERMSGKRTNIDSLNRPPQRQFSTEPLAARVPNKPARHHSVPQPAKQYGSAVMQEDDNVSTESEGESPISPMSNHSQFVNGSRSRGSGSSSSNRLLSSPINNASASLSTNYHRDEQMDSPEAKGSAENKPVKLEKLASEDDCVPLLGSPGSSLALSEAVPCVTTPSTGEVFDANTPSSSFDNWLTPELRDFCFGKPDSLLGDLVKPADEGAHTGSPSNTNNQPMETLIDTPLGINLASPESDLDLAFDSSFDAQRKPASRPMSLSNRTVDVKPKMAPPKPAPRKVEKRVCITTEL